MADQERGLVPHDAAHTRLMRSILHGVADTQMVLKGGSALLLAYGLDRFSEDLDFDSPRQVSLLDIIEKRMPVGFTIEQFDTTKNTNTVTRHRLLYSSPDGQRRLKVEVSYRSPPEACDVRVLDGLRVASIGRIAHQKLLAAHDGDKPRSKIRDLYDLDFIARRYPAAFSDGLIERFRAFASNPDDLLSRYRPDYEEDDLVPELVELETLATRICCLADELRDTSIETHRRIDHLSALKAIGGAPYTFLEHAVVATERVEKAGGSAAEVDWHAVSDAMIDEAMAEQGQTAEAVSDALSKYSPAAASGAQRTEWRAKTVAHALDLKARYEARAAKAAAATSFCPRQ